MRIATASNGLAILLICLSVPAFARAADQAVVRDECRALPGYPAFRLKLQRAVADRDGQALKALFDPAGAMRVHGIGGPVSYPWSFDRPEAEFVWNELGQILKLGCARSGRKLVLPKVATMAYDDTEPGQLVVLRRTALKSRPSATAETLGFAVPGQVITPRDDDTPPRWTPIELGRRRAYIPSAALRSPFGIRIELVPFEGGWRIRSIGDGV